VHSRPTKLVSISHCRGPFILSVDEALIIDLASLPEFRATGGSRQHLIAVSSRCDNVLDLDREEALESEPWERFDR